VDLWLWDRAKRYRRLASILAEEEPTKRFRTSGLVGKAQRDGEEEVNRTAKSQAAD
jgi:hypothetical protein